MQKVFGLFLGIVSGAVVGGLVTLLLTPASGEELRGQIRGRSQSFVDEIKDAAKERQLELEERLALLRSPNPPQQR